MGCCASCFLYTTDYDYIETEEEEHEIHKVYIYQAMRAELEAQYAREKAEGVIFIPSYTSVHSYEFQEPLQHIIQTYSPHWHHHERHLVHPARF